MKIKEIGELLQDFLIFFKTIQRPPDGAFIAVEFYFGFQYCLVFADAAGLHLGIYPQVNFAVQKNLIGNKPGLIHGRKYTIVKKGVCNFDIHKYITELVLGMSR
jgi:hypothetical protein